MQDSTLYIRASSVRVRLGLGICRLKIGIFFGDTLLRQIEQNKEEKLSHLSYFGGTTSLFS